MEVSAVYDVSFSIGRLMSPLQQIAGMSRELSASILSLPGLRGYWPMSGFDGSGNARDYCGGGLDLTLVGGVSYGYEGIAYAEFDGSTGYLLHNDVAELDVSGAESYVAPGIQGLTIGGWFRWAADQQTTGVSKWTANNLSYNITRVASGDYAQFSISGNGVAAEGVSSPNGSIPVGRWVHLVGVYNSGGSLSIFVDGVKSSQATAITSIFNGSGAFVVGALNGGAAALMQGRAAQIFICAAAIQDDVISRMYQISRDEVGV